MERGAIQKAALAYREAGLSVIRAGLNKVPIGRWKDYQKEIASYSDVEEWFAVAGCYPGIVTGKVSGNLEMIDFDNEGELFGEWKKGVVEVAHDLVKMLVIERSQSGGFHVIYRCSEGIPGNMKLAQRAIVVDGPGDHEYEGKKYQAVERGGTYKIVVTLIETRGEGGYFLVAPTPGYELIQGNPAKTLTITPRQRQILINTARSLNEWIDPGSVFHGYQSPKGSTRGKLPGEDFDERGDPISILEKHGWERTGRHGSLSTAAVEHFKRPGKDRGQSASLIEGKVFHCFTSNGAPFEMDKSYSPFAVYALLEHGGGFSKAASALSKEGLGDSLNIETGKLGNEDSNEWDNARRIFPRASYPWGVLPANIAESLLQLSRSHATSPASLPGAAIAIFSSILGATINISPKTSWREPLIFWFADVRPSGAGKTPAARSLCRVLYDAQNYADKDYKQRLDVWQASAKNDRGPEPTRARGYFNTDLTLEGLRSDITGHGGTVCVLDELSSFLNSQNQYKSRKGNDREAWLCIHDGKPARVVRAGSAVTISGARVNIFGGVQPIIWQKVFGGEGGMFIEDGTIYRFLVTFEGDQPYPLTLESWSDKNRGIWERTLTLAMEWADEIVKEDVWQAKSLCLDEEAQKHFIDWRNKITDQQADLPERLRGFLPKMVSYSLRLAGVLYCLDRFAAGSFPGVTLTLSDMEKGIKASMFFMGHIVDAMRALCTEEKVTPPEAIEHTKHVAETIESLRDKVDNGRLSLGLICERFNLIATGEQEVKAPRVMGSILRNCGLTIPVKKFRFNGKSGLTCLIWDEKTESLIKTSQLSQLSQQGTTGVGLRALTSENLSQLSQRHESPDPENVDIVAIEKPMSTPASPCVSRAVAIVAKSDEFSNGSEKWEEGTI